MLKETLIAVISSMISGLVLIFVGYLFIIKENQLIIQTLKEEIVDLEEITTETQNSLNATQLFIVSAHPGMDFSMLSQNLGESSIPELD